MSPFSFKIEQIYIIQRCYKILFNTQYGQSLSLNNTINPLGTMVVTRKTQLVFRETKEVFNKLNRKLDFTDLDILVKTENSIGFSARMFIFYTN